MAIKKLRTGVLAGCGVAAAVLSAQSTHAAVTPKNIYSTGFETGEGYSAVANTNLVGQTGGTPSLTWAQTPSTPNSVKATTNGAGKAVLKATSLSSNNSAGGGDNGVYYPSIGYNTVRPNTDNQSIITISTDVSVSSAANQYAGFGFVVYDGTSGTQNKIFSLYELGDGTVDYGGNNGFNNPSKVYGGLSSGTTQTLVATLDYSSGAYTVSVGGDTYTGTFNAAYGFGSVGLSAATFNDQAGDSGTGTFDNFSITSVPEPTTASIVVGGMAAAGLRRRRRIAR